MIRNRDTLRLQVKPWQYFDEDMIRSQQANDVGELIQRFAGVAMKSYGGLGGMKTFSYKSLSGQHSTFLLDGIPLHNTQTGQINLGTLETSTTASMSNSSEQMSYLLPASAVLAGNSFSISSFEGGPGSEGIQIRHSLSAGSFGQGNAVLAIRLKKKAFFTSLRGTYRCAQGNYPYSYMNGYQSVQAVRSNNNYESYNFGQVVGFSGKKSWIRLGYNYQSIDQQLPGAVVFYNESADEILQTNSLNAFVNGEGAVGNARIAAFSSYNRQNLYYLDPSYLNQDGKLEARYLNELLNAGLTTWYRFKSLPKIKIFGGVEQQVAWLWTSSDLLGTPQRFHNHHFAGTSLDKKQWSVTGVLGGQAVSDRNKQRKNEYYKLNPRLTINYRIPKSHAALELAYRNTFRMPNFNELYYNNMGSTDLRPEWAHQSHIEWQYSKVSASRWRTDFRLQAFYNQLGDMIIAIPSKNLFVWTMQNIGRAEAYGILADFRTKLQLGKCILGMDLNYSLQKTVDRSDRDQLSYGHQVAYIPMHSGNAGLSFSYANFQLRLDETIVGKRYSLNENIVSNELAAFAVSDLSLQYRFQFQKKQNLKIQFNVKNLFNQSYAYVRSFIMPGRSYLLTLSYALD